MFFLKMQAFWIGFAAVITAVLSAMGLVSANEQTEVANILGSCMNALVAAILSIMSVMSYAKKKREQKFTEKLEEACKSTDIKSE